MHGDSVTVTVLLAVMGIGVGVILLTGLAHRIRFSAPLLIVTVSVAVSLIPGVPALHVEPDLVLFVLLPPLLYAAARGRHSFAHYRETGHAVVGSAEAGEHWPWCFVHERVG